MLDSSRTVYLPKYVIIRSGESGNYKNVHTEIPRRAEFNKGLRLKTSQGNTLKGLPFPSYDFVF